jgi:DNA excision repair protein ERCC-5
MRDDRGEVQKNAHLVGFFRRIVRLLINRVRPVFVFDGATPALKRQTVALRRRRRMQADVKLKRVAEKLLLSQLRSHALQQVCVRVCVCACVRAYVLVAC